MKKVTHSLVIAAEDHLLSGEPISRFESLALYGVPDLPKIVSDLRKKGARIEARRVPFARAIVRVNKVASFVAPENLPVREILITEYQLTR